MDHVDNLWSDVRHNSILIGLKQTCALNFDCAHLLSWRDFKGRSPPALPAQMQLQLHSSKRLYVGPLHPNCPSVCPRTGVLVLQTLAG